MSQTKKFPLFPTITTEKSVCTRKSKMKLIKRWAVQFCLNTGLHGYKFIILPKRILLERVIWIIIVISSILIAIVLSIMAKNSLDENPTTFVTDSINHPIWNYPFPAVTICSFNKISKEKARFQAAQIVNKLNYTVTEITNMLALMGKLYFFTGIRMEEKEKVLQLTRLLDHNEMDINELLINLSPSCGDIIKKCKWKEEKRRCDTIFEKIITSEGHCCSFNYFAPRNYAFTGSYPKKAPKKPRHVSACGYQTSLEVIVNTAPDDYFSSETLAFGSKVFIHSSYDYPDWSLQSYLVGMKIMTLIGINPTKTYAKSSIRSIDPKKRFCYFQEEFQLKSFQVYSYQNCLTECRMNLSIELCGCLPIVYVNEFDYKNASLYKICSIRDLPCLEKIKKNIASSMPGKISGHENFIWKIHDYPCNCLPNCHSVDYVFEASQGILTRKFSNNNQMSLYGGVDLVNHSVVRVYFNDLVGTINRRDVLYNWQTFLAFYGGILGLFLGFNLISAIEFVYFFTIKILTNLWHDTKPRRNKVNERSNIFDIDHLKSVKKRRTIRTESRTEEPQQWFLH